MMRNQESIFHKTKIKIHGADIITIERVFTDRSLVMVCREIAKICEIFALDLGGKNFQLNSLEDLSG